MSAHAETRAEWLDSKFWDRLDRLESQHRQVQSEHETVRRRLDRADPAAVGEIREVWHRYCEVIAELDRTTGELESLRTGAR
jgi:hypothetical protein